MFSARLFAHTDFNASALVVGDTRVGGSKIDADGTIVHFVGHDVCGGIRGMEDVSMENLALQTAQRELFESAINSLEPN